MNRCFFDNNPRSSLPLRACPQITCTFGSPPLGALRRYKAFVQQSCTARFAPSSTSQLCRPNAQLIYGQALRRVLPGLALAVLASAVFAQDLGRQFPTAAKRAILEVTQPPYILLNGATERLSPGARLKSANNTLVLSGTLVGQSLLVNYLRDTQGMIHEVWILTTTEAQEKRAGMEPITNFVFGSDADKPKTDDGQTPFDQLPKFPAQ